MRRLFLCSLAVLALLAAGCSDDDPTSPPPPAGYPVADTPDKLVINFLSSQEEMKYDEYLACLDSAFQFHVDPWTFLVIGEPGYLTYAQDVAIAEQMFSGNPFSETVGAIAGIDFVVFAMIEDDWQDNAGGRLPGELVASFDILLRYQQAATDGDKLIEVRGRAEVAVVSEQVDLDGETLTRYRLSAIDDQTGYDVVKDVEDVSWTSVKMQYLPELIID